MDEGVLNNIRKSVMGAYREYRGFDNRICNREYNLALGEYIGLATAVSICVGSSVAWVCNDCVRADMGELAVEDIGKYR